MARMYKLVIASMTCKVPLRASPTQKTRLKASSSNRVEFHECSDRKANGYTDSVVNVSTNQNANKVRNTLTNSSGDYKFVVTWVKIAVSVIMTSVLDRFHFKTTNDFIYRRVYISYMWYLDSDTFDWLTHEFHRTHQNKWDGASSMCSRWCTYNV